MSAINIFDSAQVFAYLKNQLALGSSYDRLPAMLECASFCDSEDWLRELGNQWTGFDNVGAYADELARARDHRWPHATLDGGHLQFLVEPDAVADAILALVAELSDR